MEWSLTIVALAVLAVAARSGLLTGTPVTAAMAFTAVGLVVGPLVADEITLAPTSVTVRTLAEATLAVVLFSDASRIKLRALRLEFAVPVRLLGIGLPLTIALGAVFAAIVFSQVTLARRSYSPSFWPRPMPRWGRRWSPSPACRLGSAKGSTSRAG
jgi:NhaP-type Na+/H+ or K+/H+ antiporter